jgi:Cu(I)/Ag(I) efflux system membrane fusion protein
MKSFHVIAIALATTAGWFAARWSQHGPATDAATAKHVMFYQSPMHPWVRSDKPGQCTVCGMNLVPIYEGGKSLDKQMPEIVMLPQGSPNVIGVKTSEVKKRPLVRTLRVSGMIGEDESRHGVISAPVEGRIDGLSMNHAGQQVTRRQPLATIFSRTLLSAANDYKLALPQGGAPVDAAKKRLEQYGLVWEQIKAIPDRQPDDLYFGVLSPLSGVIVKSYITEGQYVKEGERLFEIADFTTMWFMFTAYEQDLPFIKPRQIVHVKVASLPGVEINARIGPITPILDEMTRSAMVRVVVENPERKLMDKSSADAVVDVEAPEVLAVRRSAVLWSGADPRVYVERKTGVYEQCVVKLGRVGDVDWEVVKGLDEGDRVVSSGNMLIDGQAQLNNLGSPARP